ncbi:hypothetical protein K6V98_08265 [Collinsella sp. AGMB00827]|uniref:DUF2829 domain-containing protein n=1 Tax=Collinsella ureilytica TaxID=2869515 RepID=A0ABS7MMS3_9ACTN|nr:hypothetical protein [Collinsella urealyticum]MBY4798338.1 hypothetical protein [Collinsella urealyticum]
MKKQYHVILKDMTNNTPLKVWDVNGQEWTRGVYNDEAAAWAAYHSTSARQALIDSDRSLNARLNTGRAVWLECCTVDDDGEPDEWLDPLDVKEYTGDDYRAEVYGDDGEDEE